MSNEITSVYEFDSDDNRPLPERIASLYSFKLASQDVENSRNYAVQDWISGIIPTADVRKLWSIMKRRYPQLSTACRQLPYKATNGKTYPMDYATAETLYLITQRLQANSGNRDKVLQYLAKAGVLLDEMIRNPNVAASFFADLSDEKDYRDCLKEGMTHEQALQWVQARRNVKEETKLSRTEWHIRGVSKQSEYGRLNNDVSRAAIGKTATSMKRSMQITRTPRDFLSAADNATIGIVYMTSRMLHVQRESQGVDELSDDIKDVKPIVDAARHEIENVFSKKPRRLPSKTKD